jgi:hypothetical protein
MTNAISGDSRISMLLIWGGKLDPREAAQACGWEEWKPQLVWRKGDKVAVDSHATHEYAGLKLWPKPEWLSETLEEQLGHWVKVLSAKAIQLERLRNKGARVTIHCALLANDTYYVSADIQAELGRLDVGLGIEVAVACSLTAR